MKRKMDRQKAVRTAAVAMAVTALGAGAFAYFTDYETAQVSAKAGTLTMEMENVTEDLTNGLTILNPGDSSDLAFTVKNTGEKSMDIKAVLTVSTDHEEGFSDDHEYKITDNTGSELTGVLDAEKKSLTYTIDDVVLRGLVEKSETDGDSAEHTYDYQFMMDEAAGNSWQGTEADVKIEVYAKQHRNTESMGNDWISIVEK